MDSENGLLVTILIDSIIKKISGIYPERFCRSFDTCHARQIPSQPAIDALPCRTNAARELGLAQAMRAPQSLKTIWVKMLCHA